MFSVPEAVIAWHNIFRRNSGTSDELVSSDVDRVASFDSFTQEEEELRDYMRDYGTTPPRTARQRRKERDAYW